MSFHILYRVVKLLNSAARNRFIAALAVISMAPLSSATDYAGGFTIGVNASHNDNLRMVKSDKTAVYRYDASPILTLNANTETSTLSLSSTFDFNRYTDNAFDSNDQNFALAFAHQFERSSLGLDAAVIRQSTTTSELLGSGRIGTKADPTEQYQLSPSWSYTANEENLLQLKGTYTVQNYHNTAYLGYKNIGSQADWIYVITEKIKWITSATYSSFHSDDVTIVVPGGENNFFPFLRPDGSTALVNFAKGAFGAQSYSTKTKNIGAQIGLDYQSSESSLLQARLGRSKNTSTFPSSDPQNICSNPIERQFSTLCDIPSQRSFLSTAELDWTWHNERQKFSLNSTKSTQPTSNGYAVDAIQVGSSWSYTLSELDQISASVSIVRNRAIDKKNTIQKSTTGIADRDYGSATIGYSHQVGTDWFLDTSYQFSKQKYTQTDDQANSNIFSLGIRYRPQQWHWSR